MTDVLAERRAVVAHLDDLPIGRLRMVRVGDRRLCLVRTSDGVHAIDNACPHEGYGLTQGALDGEVLTCEWHNWKYRVSDGACLRGEEDVRSHAVTIETDGSIVVELSEPTVDELRPVLLSSLERAIEKDYVGQISRDVVRLLRADAHPGELVWRAIAHGAPRSEFGWGHSIASATDALAQVGHYDGDERALPIVQAIASVAEAAYHEAVQPLPDPMAALPSHPAAAFRAAVEAEDLKGAQALVLAGVDAGLGPNELHRWLAGAVSDHHLSYGHGAIYTQKAFELLELLGWDRARTVLPHLVPSIVWGTREDRLPYMRTFARRVGSLDLGALYDIEPAAGWRDDGMLLAALLGPDKSTPLDAAVGALNAGAGVDGLLDVIVAAVAERMLRYDTSQELVREDDFGWLDITHGLTYVDAVRWHHRHDPGPDTLRLALWCLFQAHWTGRHEWHTPVAPRGSVAPRDGDVIAACLERRPDDAVAAVAALGVGDGGLALQRVALLDATATPIVHAHAVKTTRAAAKEAELTGSVLPLAATARFLAGPRQERFVASIVTRSIEFISGRAPRD